MKCLTTILAVALSPLAANAACIEERIIPHYVDFGWVRGQPDLNGTSLWRLNQGSTVVYCGYSSLDQRGIDWHWVMFRSVQEPWEHNGWISSRIMEPVTNVQSTLPQGPTVVPPLIAQAPWAPAPAPSTVVIPVPAQAPAIPNDPPLATYRSAYSSAFTEADIPKMHSEYEANQARFFAEYKGKPLSAHLPLGRVTESLFGKGYVVALGDGSVSCNDVPQSDFIIGKNKGDMLFVRGTIIDHTFGEIILKDCDLSN